MAVEALSIFLFFTNNPYCIEHNLNALPTMPLEEDNQLGSNFAHYSGANCERMPAQRGTQDVCKEHAGELCRGKSDRDNRLLSR